MKKEIEDYVTAITKAYHESPFWGGENGKNADQHKFSIEYGKKFAKVVHNSWGQNSVHCFVEIATGDIYKAATWKAPAKGVRGNIKNEKRPVFDSDYYRIKL